MTASTLVPVEEYLAAHYDPDMEYVDGVLVERNVGEPLHARLQGLIWDAFRALEKTHDVVAFVECRLLVAEGPPKRRYRIPDVCLMRRPVGPGPALVDAPLVVVEVLSPEDAMSDAIDKCLEYQRRGARHIWIADPKGRVLVWRAAGLEICGPIRLHIDELAAEIAFDDIFAELMNLRI